MHSADRSEPALSLRTAAGGSTETAILSPPAPQSPAGREPLARLLHIAWLAIGLGLTMHLGTTAVQFLAGSGIAQIPAAVRDAAQKVSWSVFVCVGVGLGTAVAKARPAWAGLAGLLTAPLAFIAARTVQKGVATAVGAAPPAQVAAAVFMAVLVLKAAQYALFGALLAWVGRQRWGGLWAHVGTGAACGIVFGLSSVAVLAFGSPARPPAPVLLAQGFNELLFPVGCALVLYIASRLAPRLAKGEVA